MEKEILEFSKCRDTKDGLGSWCKNCRREYAKKYEQTDKRKEYLKEYRQTDKCKESQIVFRQSEKAKEYRKKYNKEYAKAHKEYFKEYAKSDKRKIYQREYGKLDSRRKYIRNYEKVKRIASPKFHLDCNMSGAIYKALKGKKHGRHWEKLVGYTVTDLMNHLESKFEPWMNWNNYGKWHIDHIKPISLFNFLDIEDNEFKECWALSNLQPMEAVENIRKSNKY